MFLETGKEDPSTAQSPFIEGSEMDSMTMNTRLIEKYSTVSAILNRVHVYCFVDTVSSVSLVTSLFIIST